MAVWQSPLEGMGVNPQFWAGKRVLLTGHTGFKGSWMALWLQSMGAHVVGYALAPPTNPSLFEIASVAQGMTSVLGDIRDLAALQRVFAEHQPEIVIHMAAQPLVRYSYQNPVETYSTNVMGTVHLLEVVRQTPGVKAVVNITTDKCYENREWVWGYRENEPMGGHDTYSNSKGCAELVSASFRASFFNASNYAQHGVAVATVRAGNVIGGGDWAADRLLPDFFRAQARGEALAVRHPDAIRPWQHVLEPLAGYLQLAERLIADGAAFAEAWNFGPSDELVLPVGELATKLAAAWGGGAAWVGVGEPGAPHEARLLRLDASRARGRLGWRPALSLDATLAWIVEWHQAVGRGDDARAVTLAQLARYAAGAA